MKKLLNVVGVSLVALSAIALFSCKNPSYDARTDTVINLDAPSVSAKAFPGVNYISWSPVASAAKYELYRNNSYISTIERTENLIYVDIATGSNLVDGKSYEYTVVAVSNSDVARAIVAQSSKGSASVTANVPAAGTSTLDLNANYAEKFSAENLANNVTFSTKNGYVYASFPATNGVNYEIKDFTESQISAYKAQGNQTYASNLTSSNAVYNIDDSGSTVEYAASSPITTSGKHTIYVAAKSVSSLYPASSVEVGTVTIPDFDESSSVSNVTASYYNDNQILVTWTPAILSSTNEKDSTANYKVYRSSQVDSVWQAVSGTVVEASSSTYSLIDNVSDTTVSYTYYVIHTDGTNYGTYNDSNNVATVSAKTSKSTSTPTLSISTYIDSTDNLSDTIKVSATKANQNQTLALSYVQLPETGTSSYTESAFKTLTLENEDGYDNTYVSYVNDADAGTYLFKLTASEDGKNSTSVYKTVTVNEATVSSSGLSLSYSYSYYSSSAAYLYVYDIIPSLTDSISNYTYSLYKVVTTIDSDYTNYVTVETSLVKENLTLEKYYYGSNRYIASTSVEARNNTYYNNTEYYVVKALKSDSTKYVKMGEGIGIPTISYNEDEKVISWDEIANASRYYVYSYYSNDDYDLNNFNNYSSQYGTSYSVTTPWKYNEYFAVKTYGYVSGNYKTSEFSNVVTVEPVTPSAPEVTYSDTNSYLSWDGIDGATSYYISYATSDTELSDADALEAIKNGSSISTSNTYYYLSSYISWTKYTYFAVRAYKSDENVYTDYSDITKVAPTATAPVVTYSSGTLSWNSVDDATRYYIYRNTTNDFSNVSSYYTTTYNTYYYYAYSNQGYYYAVKAYNNSKYEYTDFSNVVMDTEYSVIYNGSTIKTINGADLSTYESLLTEGTDYSIDTDSYTITLTDSGYNKVSTLSE